MKTLGPEIDIHAGGIDNIYRHHDYNRAVVEAATDKELAHYWMHCKHLIVNGEKMSKSKGNTLYPEDIFNDGYDATHVRFLLIYGYYREELDITEEYIRTSCKKLDEIRADISSVREGRCTDCNSSAQIEKLIAEVPRAFKTKMNDNLRIMEAVDCIAGILRDFVSVQTERGVNKKQQSSFLKELEQIDRILGVLF
jgi:cysteinyl-tRNA synthetase